MPGDRTEQATPHRREKARQEGDVLRSRELISAAGTLAGVLCLAASGGKFFDSFHSLLAAALSAGSTSGWEQADLKQAVLALRKTMFNSCIPALVPMCAIVAASVLCGVVQSGGLQINGSALGLRLERINPVANAKNLFSLRAASRLGRSLVPAGILAVLAFQRIARELRIPPFSTKRMELLASDIYELLIATALLLLGWAVVDYVVEWRSRESRLMMSREEMKQEFKETEGSPQTRSRIRGLQRQMRRRKVKADVSKAAVVLTNPTHFAVAMGFNFATMDAPKVLAKGRNLLAEEIKAEARWAGVPIVENPPLARSLYRSVEVGQAIPAELYAAVAAILAYLYRQRMQEEMRARRAREASKSVINEKRHPSSRNVRNDGTDMQSKRDSGGSKR